MDLWYLTSRRFNKSKSPCITASQNIGKSSLPFRDPLGPEWVRLSQTTKSSTGPHKHPPSLFKAPFSSVYIHCPWLYMSFECKPSTLSPSRFLNSGFWARGRLYTVSIGGENQEILFAFLGKKKIEAGGELNCLSRGLDVMIRLLLASLLLGLRSSHSDWTAPTPTGSLGSQEIRARPDSRLFVLGLVGSLTRKGGVGGSRLRSRGVTFHPEPGLLLWPPLLQLPARPPGGFLQAVKPRKAPLTHRLGESTRPADAAQPDAQKRAPLPRVEPL